MRRYRLTVLATMVVLCALYPCAGQEGAAETRDDVETNDAVVAASPATEPALTARVLLDEIRFSGIRLGDLIDHLRERDPSFQAVVSYPISPPEAGGAGAGESDVMIDELLLRDVMADEVLAAVAEAYPQVQVQKVPLPSRDDPHAGIWAIRVRALDSISTATFRLSEAVDTVSVENPAPAARAGARNEVVALLTSVAEAEPTQVKPTLKLHEATEVLVVRGNARQIALVKEALESLSAPPPARQARTYQQTIRRHLQRIAELEPMVGQVQTLTQERTKLEKENRRLAERVRELEKLMSVRSD